ncbi:MAG: hypothetical protein JST11_09690 [Acidobacteria bacterium]|nr:hypothetical protein [Acidobacteriota bacterium]
MTNTGSQSLAGIAIRFRLDFGQRAVNRDFFYHSFSQPESPVLPGGQSRVFTPLKTANAVAAQATRTQMSAGQGAGASPGPTNPASEFTAMQALASAEQITITIDLAVAADGKIAGPDQALTVKRLSEDLSAYSAMRAECLTRLASGESDSSIQAWLEPLATQRVFRDPSTGFGNRYIDTQKMVASGWLADLTAGRRTKLLTFLTMAKPEIIYPMVGTLRGGLR